MLESASGIILRTRLLTETSLIVVWLTAEHGRLSTVAKGARRPKSSYLGKLDLFYEVNFSFHRSRRSELHTLREVLLRETHATLRQDLQSLRQASYCTALIEAATEIDTPIPAIHQLFRETVRVAASSEPRPETLFTFELKLLHELGLGPDFSECRLTPGASKLASAFLSESWDFISHIRATPSQIGELGQFLHNYLAYHIGRIPPGRELALA
ncbi:MAG: DNA repair protein RecO [Verrucomicrobiota bacterium]|nr:DNA repair protein RecO [Verrucomicrobiota bacterium]